MSYTVFKNNNKSITAPNESGEIVLKSSISKQIRIEVNRNTYQFYDILEKRYLKLSEIEAIDPKMCLFTAIIYPCSSASDPEVDITLVESEDNYPIVYKFVDSCLGSTLSLSHINLYNGHYWSNNIYLTRNNSYLTIEFEFYSGVKVRLNRSLSGSTTQTMFSFTSDDVEIISLFQHNIIINARRDISGTTNTTYLYSLSFSFINNRSEQYNKDGLTTSSQVLSMIEDLPTNKRYPASGLLYIGRYSNGASTMSIGVYTINYIYSTSNSLNVHALYANIESTSTSTGSVVATNQSITPSVMHTLTITDNVIQLS